MSRDDSSDYWAHLDAAPPITSHDFNDMARDQTGEAIAAVLKAAPKPRREPAFRRGVSALALMAMAFEPINYIIPGYVAEGLTLLAGSPKIGKSWLALNLGISVASGRPAFGSIAVEEGDVLYLALEDNSRRLRKRLIHMNQGTPERLTFMTEWPTMDDGCVDELRAWVQAVERPRLIIVDVLTKVRGGTRNGEAAYEGDYRAMTGLQGLAGEYGLAIIVVHHTRKMEAEDPFDSVSGTRGLTGAADTVLVLKRDIGTGRPGQATLYGRGRDIEEIETAVHFERDNGTWQIIGASHEVAKTDERQEILDCLRKSANPLSAREVSDLIGKPWETVRRTITRMVAAGEIERKGKGAYTCPGCPGVPFRADDAPTGTVGTTGTGFRSFPVSERDPADDVFEERERTPSTRGGWAKHPANTGWGPPVSKSLDSTVETSTTQEEYMTQRKSWDHGGKSRHARGYGKEHERIRAELLSTVVLCEECTRQGKVTAGTIADHIIPLAAGGTGDRSNYQLLCVDCDRAKLAIDNGKVAHARKPEIGLDGWPV